MRRYFLPLACLAVFLLILMLVSQGVFVSFDRHAFLAWHTDGSWQRLLLLFSVPVVSLFLAALLILAPKLRSRRGLSVIAIFALILSCELILKLLFAQPAGSLHQSVLWWQLQYSFPSGHAMRAAFFLTLLGALGPRWFRLLLLAVAGFVAWGLVSSGAHYPSDVLGGLSLGLAAGLFVNLIVSRKELAEPASLKEPPAPPEAEV